MMKIMIIFMFCLVALNSQAKIVECKGYSDYLLVDISNKNTAELLEFKTNYPFSFDVSDSTSLTSTSFISDKSTRGDEALAFTPSGSRLFSQSEQSEVSVTFIFPENILEKKVSKRKFKVEVDLYYVDGNMYTAFFDMKKCMVIK